MRGLARGASGAALFAVALAAEASAGCASRAGPAAPCVESRPASVAVEVSPRGVDVAVTVDDLPRHGPDVPGLSRLAIHQAFVAAFRAHHLPPVYGFLVGGQLDSHPEDRAALKAWLAAGNALGSHTRTHPDIYKTTVDAYLADFDANEPLLRQLEGADERAWKVFRYPYLQEGTDLPSRARVREHVLARGYRIAEVTIDFYDWAYNDSYARCLAKHDSGAIAALKKNYLDDAGLFLRWADASARALFGRPIPQILLLHIGAFDSLMIGDLLALYEKLGARFVSLDQALADPVYAEEPRSPKAWEGTFLSQVAEARGTTDPPEPNLPEGLLDAICR